MYKMTVPFEDFNGEERVGDFYFNITKAEASEWELSKDGGLSTLLEKIVKEKKMSEIIGYFKEILIKAYGEKSLDGMYFDKSEEVKKRFVNSAAFSEIYMKLITDEEEAARFVNNILPKDLRAKAEEKKNEVIDAKN